MLESAIPALWSTVHGWFTPAVLFLVLNIVIGTIAVSSKVTSAAGGGEGGAAEAAAGAAAGGEKRGLSRVPSMALDRLRSFRLSRHAAAVPEPPVAGFVDLGLDEYLPPLEKEEPEPEEQDHAHIERSMSEAAAEPELPRLPARLRKSASDKSAFAHFVVEEDTEAVEARRPATTRDRPRRPLVVAEPEEPVSEEEPEEAAGEVDARADDFINKFHHQLKLQRIDSFMRYRDTLRRGQPTAQQ
ncbi:pathogen-associated molecular patterns-induced protein A70-like [Lolium rigidum]|uniref:pathogen-associated molecular patterns-induced protein A70-like n=1 Tax=Lolium rigidum TaxID=89674 RepID=UPI001F5DB8B1|nr:pathogen-associated molecular patterns-induced protein A70-like [Lolium rigidum]